ncbi:MAG: DMT family transporter [Bacteroidetes bacterium]|nr:DMT family transporter [Bacteroidota bacterium]
MHLAIVLWGFTAILGKVILLDEGLLVWYRMLLSTIATGIFLFATSKMRLLPKKQFLQIVTIGFLITLHWITFYGAIKASNVSIAISCFSSVALFTAILDPLLHGKKPKVPEILTRLAVIVGIYIIFLCSNFTLKEFCYLLPVPFWPLCLLFLIRESVIPSLRKSLPFMSWVQGFYYSP